MLHIKIVTLDQITKLKAIDYNSEIMRQETYRRGEDRERMREKKRAKEKERGGERELG